MNKVKVFEKELSWIVDPKIKAFAEKLIEYAPDYFWTASSSSTGKYHAGYAAGPGGLCRHCKATAKLLNEMLRLEMFNKYSQEQKDMMIVAMFSHDFFKYGLPEKAGKYTVADHPTVCRDFIFGNEELCSMLEPEQVRFIGDCIAAHTGQWNTDYRSKKEILPKPVTGPQNLVHLCDLLASRKYIAIDFEGDWYEPETDKSVAPAAETPKQDNALAAVKTQIVDRCKRLIADGMDNKKLYELIAAENGGNRNPNSITDLGVANTVLHTLEELHV